MAHTCTWDQNKLTYCKFENFARVLFSHMRSFVKINPREMEKSLCRLVISVNRALVANFKVANMSFDAICESKILANIPEFYSIMFISVLSIEHQMSRYFISVKLKIFSYPSVLTCVRMLKRTVSVRVPTTYLMFEKQEKIFFDSNPYLMARARNYNASLKLRKT